MSAGAFDLLAAEPDFTANWKLRERAWGGRSICGPTTRRSLWRKPAVLTSPNCAPSVSLAPARQERNGMKALVAIMFAAGVCLMTLSSAQAIIVTAAPLAEAAK